MLRAFGIDTGRVTRAGSTTFPVVWGWGQHIPLHEGPPPWYACPVLSDLAGGHTSSSTAAMASL